eukprot:4958474-Amphidinium_carterae.1
MSAIGMATLPKVASVERETSSRSADCLKVAWRESFIFKELSKLAVCPNVDNTNERTQRGVTVVQKEPVGL